MNIQKRKDPAPKITNKTTTTREERYRRRKDKAENKARAIASKARRRKAGHEAVSDQKSHEYH